MPSSVSLEPKLGIDFPDDSSSSLSESDQSRPNSVEKSSSSDDPKMGISDRVEEELSRLWDSGQEWILIFDNLLKHPGGKVSKGCKCDMCQMQKYHTVSSGNVEKSTSSSSNATKATSEISGNLTIIKS